MTAAKVDMFCEVYLHSNQKFDYHVRKEFNIILIRYFSEQYELKNATNLSKRNKTGEITTKHLFIYSSLSIVTSFLPIPLQMN